MIKTATGDFAKKTVKKGTGAWTKGNMRKSTNLSSKKLVKEGTKAWEGQNTSDAGLGDDLFSPENAGVFEPGAFRHFQVRQQPVINH